MTPSTNDLLLTLIVEVRALRHAFERLVPSRLSRKDRHRLEEILPPLAAHFADAPFTSSEALAVLAVTGNADGLSAKALGKFFSRCAGEFVDDLYLGVCGEEGHISLWQISSLRVSGLSGDYTAA